jgi:citronellol/citronellal dehydrogenase
VGRMDGQVAVVTGASRGIGQALVVRLAAEGATVLAVGRSLEGGGRFAGSLAETTALAERARGRVIPVVAAVGTTAGRDAVEAAAAEVGPVTIVVNNAAAPRAFDLRFPEMDETSFRLAVDVNVWGAWNLAARFVPAMRTAGRGWILNVTSAQAAPRSPQGTNKMGGACLYGGTKAMLDRITTGAAQDLYPDGIAVNALAPEAAVATEHASSVGLPPDRIEPVETFAEAALALVSGDPTVLTGRIAYSLSLVKELGLPVRTLDRTRLLPGWQPDDIDERRLFSGYLSA